MPQDDHDPASGQPGWPRSRTYLPDGTSDPPRAGFQPLPLSGNPTVSGSHCCSGRPKHSSHLGLTTRLLLARIEAGDRCVARALLLGCASTDVNLPGACRAYAGSRRRLAVTATAAYRIVKLPPSASIVAPRPASSSLSFAGGNWLWPPKVGASSSHSLLVYRCSQSNCHRSGSLKTLTCWISSAVFAKNLA